MIIAIDGPSASGKGTLARRLAAHFGLAHLDTGALYRAVGLAVLRAGGDPDEPSHATKAAASLNLALLDDPSLRSDPVAVAASKVSAIPDVRQALLDRQRAFAHQPGGAVLDGRDIGTVIAPDADVKLFVTASAAERARRRHAELTGHGQPVSYAEVLADIEARDARDSGRAAAPLRPAPDAVHLDTDGKDTDAVFAEALAILADKTGAGR
jgi:cytidylate kinase